MAEAALPFSAADLKFVCLGFKNITPDPKNFEEALSLRCKYIDAWYIFKLPPSKRPNIVWTSNEHDPRLGPADPMEMADANTFLLLLTLMNKYSALSNINELIGFPAHLLFGKMRFEMNPMAYARMAASFDIRRADDKWFSGMTILGLGETIETGLTLPWRPYCVFEGWEDKPELPANVNRAAQFCKKLASFPPSWDYHPKTWPKAIEEQLSPVVENVWSLATMAFSPMEVAFLVETGHLPAMPISDGSMAPMKWEQWDPALVVAPTRFIFRVAGLVNGLD